MSFEFTVENCREAFELLGPRTLGEYRKKFHDIPICALRYVAEMSGADLCVGTTHYIETKRQVPWPLFEIWYPLPRWAYDLRRIFDNEHGRWDNATGNDMLAILDQVTGGRA